MGFKLYTHSEEVDMKPEARLLTVLSIALLFVLSSQLTCAQGSLRISDLETLLARLDAYLPSAEITGTESFRNTYNLYYESGIELENWMLDTGSWYGKQQELKPMEFAGEPQEREIVMEKWMTNPVISENTLLNRYIRVEEEGTIPLEVWMLSRHYWTRN
jgi:hypothetical protein